MTGKFESQVDFSKVDVGGTLYTQVLRICGDDEQKALRFAEGLVEELKTTKKNSKLRIAEVTFQMLDTLSRMDTEEDYYGN